MKLIVDVFFCVFACSRKEKIYGFRQKKQVWHKNMTGLSL